MFSVFWSSAEYYHAYWHAEVPSAIQHFLWQRQRFDGKERMISTNTTRFIKLKHTRCHCWICMHFKESKIMFIADKHSCCTASKETLNQSLCRKKNFMHCTKYDYRVFYNDSKNLYHHCKWPLPFSVIRSSLFHP